LKALEEIEPLPFVAVTMTAYVSPDVRPVKMAELEARPLSVEGLADEPFKLYV